MPWRSMKALAKSFELSSRAAARVGPKIRKPAARNASTMPAASGPSGPTTVRPTASARAKSTSSVISVSATLLSSGSRAVPALPGATKTLPTRGERAIRHASACSRPPPPTTRTFIVRPSLEVDLAEDVENGAVIDAAVQLRDVGGDHFDLLMAQGEQRQQHRHRHAAGDIRALDDHRREAQPGLDGVAIEPVGRPAVSQVVLRLAVGVVEHQEEHVLGVPVGLLARAHHAAAPGEGVFHG